MDESTRHEQHRAWMESGTAELLQLSATVRIEACHGPTRLVGWHRGHLLTHLARNADAVGNLLEWAHTGVETPMYDSTDARARDIEQGAGRGRADLLADLAASCGRLDRRIAAMPCAAWAARVRTATGRRVEATEVLWLRAREVWLHAVDLDLGLAVADLPTPLCAALLADVAATLTSRHRGPAIRLVATDGYHTATVGSGEAPVVVYGATSALVGWLAGRGPTDQLTASTSVLPSLPAWL